MNIEQEVQRFQKMYWRDYKDTLLWDLVVAVFCLRKDLHAGVSHDVALDRAHMTAGGAPGVRIPVELGAWN